jgi:hypothetical protein
MVRFWTQFFSCLLKFALLINVIFEIRRHVVRPKFNDVSKDLVASIIRVDDKLHIPEDSNIIATTVRTFFIVEIT